MSYKKLGDLVRFISNKNTDERATVLYGINIDKFFMPSVANTIGVDLKKYKVVDNYQFACNRMHVGRDERLPIAMSTYDYPFIVSPAYDVFEVIDTNVVIPEYLMLWFRRGEFDRQCWFYTDADVRGGLHLDALKAIEIEVPSIEKQREIVAQYEAVANKIKVNEAICEKLEATAQALYKQWFVDFEFPVSDTEALVSDTEALEVSGVASSASATRGYKSSGGTMVFNEELEKEIPEGWEVGKLETVSNLKYGKMLDSDKFLDSGFPVFSGYGVRGYYSEYMYEKEQILVLCRGVSGTGEVRLSPKFSYITNLSIVVEIQEDVMKKFFTYYYLKNDDLKSLDSGSAQSMITTGDLYFRDILIPNFLIQLQFEEQILKLHNCKESLKEQNQKLTQLQSLLLSRLATLEG